jgi:hypothetical protein
MLLAAMRWTFLEFAYRRYNIDVVRNVGYVEYYTAPLHGFLLCSGAVLCTKEK